MPTIHEIRIRSNEYIANIDNNIIEALESVEQGIVDLNRNQMLENKDALGNALKNLLTGSTNLSEGYAKRKGKTKPNLYDSGDFQFDMFADFRLPDEYFIQSSDDKAGFLDGYMFENIFGIAEENRDEAKEITTMAILEHYTQKVYG